MTSTVMLTAWFAPTLPVVPVRVTPAAASLMFSRLSPPNAPGLKVGTGSATSVTTFCAVASLLPAISVAVTVMVWVPLVKVANCAGDRARDQLPSVCTVAASG